MKSILRDFIIIIIIILLLLFNSLFSTCWHICH